MQAHGFRQACPKVPNAGLPTKSYKQETWLLFFFSRCVDNEVAVENSFRTIVALCIASLHACGFIGYERQSLEGMGEPAAEEIAPQALPPVFAPLGESDGHWGALTLTAGTTVINAYAALTSDLGAGVSSVVLQENLSTFRVRVGDLLLLWQAAARPASPPVSGVSTALSLAELSMGHWEWQRVAAVAGSTIDFAAPTQHAYTGGLSQLILVPEYTRLEVPTNASIVAQAWNGRTGGIVAFLASAEIVVDGRVDAVGAGYRSSLSFASDDHTACSALDDMLSGTKGEGALLDSYMANARGRGNLAQGGGGGACLAAGGGGGGHVGSGGKGGRSADGSRDVGGIGGAPVVYDPAEYLSMGGAGGSGHALDDEAILSGAGGGVIWMRAPRLTGMGSIDASGQSPKLASGSEALTEMGAGGGGAGGLIYLHFAESLRLATIRARGAAGGSGMGVGGFSGPGGGGSGGKIHAISADIQASFDVTGGAPGTYTRDDTGQSSTRNALAGGLGELVQRPP